MKEPPIELDSDGIHARPRRTGHALADLVLALSAILISVISLWVAVEHGRTERELVAASTWPFPVVGTYRIHVDKQGMVSKLVLRNAGVGPARLVSMVIRLDGRVQHSPGDLLSACCGVPAGTTTNNREQYGVIDEGSVLGVLEAHQQIDFLGISEKGDATRRALETVWQRLSYEGCYCLVLNECWRSEFSSTGEPKRVAACHASSDDYHD